MDEVQSVELEVAEPDVSTSEGATSKNVKVWSAVVGLLTLTGIVVASVVRVSAGPPEWHPQLLPLVSFVEAERGLEFKRPIRLELLDPADFGLEEAPDIDEIEDIEEEAPEFAPPEFSSAFELLGVQTFDPGFLASAAETVEFVPAAFDSGSGARIVIPDNADLQALSPILVHELTHALQFQHGMFGGDAFAVDSDEFRMYLALIEGDATRIEHAFVAQMTAAEIDRYIEAGGLPAARYRDPSWNSDSYAIGEPLVKALIARDGLGAFDELTRSNTVLSTSLYVDVLGDPTQSVDAEAEIELPDSIDHAHGEIGANGWFITLAPLVGTADAFDAVIGYDADAFAVYENSSSSVGNCVHSAVFFDTANDAVEFSEIIGAIDIVSEVSEERRSVMMDICEPLGDADLQKAGVVLPMIVVQQLAWHHLDSGLSSDAARCAAIAQAKTVPADGDLDNFDGYDGYFADSTSFVSDCG